MFNTLPAALGANPAISARFAFADLSVAVVSGGQTHRLHFNKGAASFANGDGPVAFTLSASAEDWARYASERPLVGYQTLSGMMETGALAASGAGLLEFARYMCRLSNCS